MPEKTYRKRLLNNRALKPETLMMGYGYDPMLSEGSLKPPLFSTSTFVFRSAEHGKDFFASMQGRRPLAEGEEAGLIYSRFNNPNLEVLEDRLALWDEAECSLAFASGMAAISTTLWAYCRPGDVILQSQPIYGGTESLIRKILPEFGIQQVGFFVEDGAKSMQAAAKKAAKLGRVACILLETPANPTNGLVDIAAAREISDGLACSGHRPPVIVDNTMLGPVFQTPLASGADITVTSLTKYVGGHSDLIAGSVSGSRAMMAPVRRLRSTLGSMTDPHTAWLLMRSLETLKLRMEASAANAARVAEFLRGHDRIENVWFLDFLPKRHPDRKIFERQCKSAGSTFSFEVKGGERAAFAVLDRLQVIKLAVSLGGTETLASHPAAMTHSDMPPEILAKLGVTPGLIRISIGIEDGDDLIADLAQALDAS